MLKIDEMAAYYCIYMDFRKAFDVVTHRLQIMKNRKKLNVLKKKMAEDGNNQWDGARRGKS